MCEYSCIAVFEFAFSGFKNTLPSFVKPYTTSPSLTNLLTFGFSSSFKNSSLVSTIVTDGNASFNLPRSF